MSISLITNPKIEDEVKIMIPTDGGLVDAKIIPAYCLSCKKQLDGFFHYNGSRYGQVGQIECNHCCTKIFCTDHDNVQHLIYMSPDEYFNRFVYSEEKFDSRGHRLDQIDFNALYQVNREIMGKLRQRLATKSFLKPFVDKVNQMEINQLVDLTCKKLYIKALPREYIITDERLPRLPSKVNRWLNLLKMLEII